MEYVTLGKTGLKVSKIGLGGIPIQKIDAEGTRTLVHKLSDRGVNYIDTARGYTVSEEYLGYALEGIRDKFVIATKSMARTREAMAADIKKKPVQFEKQIILIFTRYIIQVWSSWIRFWQRMVHWRLCRRQRRTERSDIWTDRPFRRSV